MGTLHRFDFSTGKLVPQSRPALMPGTPLLHEDMANYSPGFLLGPDPRDPENYGRVVKIDHETGEGRAIQSTPWSVIECHAEKAAGWHAATDEQLERLRAQAETAADAHHRAQQAERARIAARNEAFAAEWARRCPSWAKGIVVAERDVDDCDTMTDYFNTKQEGPTVVLAFLKHDRKLFSAMRKAAATWEETAHLADAPKSAEHRENYSMGRGNYLKAGDAYDSGWRITVRSLGYRPPAFAEFRGAAAE